MNNPPSTRPGDATTLGSTARDGRVRAGDHVTQPEEVTDAESQPTLGEGNAFEGNTEQNQITDGDVPGPDAAPPLP